MILCSALKIVEKRGCYTTTLMSIVSLLTHESGVVEGAEPFRIREQVTQ